MGYKTTDPREVMKLQKEGHSVVGIDTNDGKLKEPVYEFDFEGETGDVAADTDGEKRRPGRPKGR